MRKGEGKGGRESEKEKEGAREREKRKEEKKQVLRREKLLLNKGNKIWAI